jgi:hypothetical protein
MEVDPSTTIVEFNRTSLQKEVSELLLLAYTVGYRYVKLYTSFSLHDRINQKQFSHLRTQPTNQPTSGLIYSASLSTADELSDKASFAHVLSTYVRRFAYFACFQWQRALSTGLHMHRQLNGRRLSHPSRYTRL